MWTIIILLCFWQNTVYTEAVLRARSCLLACLLIIVEYVVHRIIFFWFITWAWILGGFVPSNYFIQMNEWIKTRFHFVGNKFKSSLQKAITDYTLQMIPKRITNTNNQYTKNQNRTTATTATTTTAAAATNYMDDILNVKRNYKLRLYINIAFILLMNF